MFADGKGADPEAGIGYAYVCNRRGKSKDDPRDVELGTAMTSCVEALA